MLYSMIMMRSTQPIKSLFKSNCRAKFYQELLRFEELQGIQADHNGRAV
jgi:hypothetical protein